MIGQETARVTHPRATPRASRAMRRATKRPTERVRVVALVAAVVVSTSLATLARGNSDGTDRALGARATRDVDRWASYSIARAPSSREVAYGSVRNASADEEGASEEEGGGDALALRLTAPPWCGSTRSVARALERELERESAMGVKIVWERPWRPKRRGRGRGTAWEETGLWGAPRAEFVLDGTLRVRYGGEWSAGALARATRALARERFGKNASALAMWPFVTLRGKYAVGDFFDAGAELSLVVLDPCKAAAGCASSASMPLLRDAVLSKIGYRAKNKLGILMGADAWRVGMQLVDPFDTDDITAVAFVRGELHSVWMANDAKNDTTVEEWVDSVAEVITSTVAQRGFFSLSNFTPAVETGKMAVIFANEADEDLDELTARIHQLVHSSKFNATSTIIDTSRGTWFLCQITDSCEEGEESDASQIRVALVDADADTIETVDVSPLPEDAISTTRPFLRSAKSVPKTPPGVTPPRIPHITRNQLDHKAAQTMGIRKSGVFFVLYGSPGCSFCQRFHGLLNAAVDDLDARAFASKTEPKRVFQIDCALNDCHARWNAETRALVHRARRYPTLIKYDGARGTSETYDGPYDALDLQTFLL